MHENVVFSVCLRMGNAAYIIYIMWSSISVRIVATTALLDPVRHTAQAMVLLKQSRRIVVETPFSLFLVWVGYSWRDLQLFNWLFQERSGRQRV